MVDPAYDLQLDSCNWVDLEDCVKLDIKLIKCLTPQAYLPCDIVSKGTAVVRETPAEEAGRQR